MTGSTPSQSCGKKLYQSWRHAANDAKALRRKGHPEQVYYCRKCQCWHVGANMGRLYKFGRDRSA